MGINKTKNNSKMFKATALLAVASAHQFPLLEQHTRDLPTCIADLEAMIPGVEKVIEDIKNQDYAQALADGEALLPDAEKAMSDCLNNEFRFERLFQEVAKVNFKHFGVEHLDFNGEAFAACGNDVVE